MSRNNDGQEEGRYNWVDKTKERRKIDATEHTDITMTLFFDVE